MTVTPKRTPRRAAPLAALAVLFAIIAAMLPAVAPSPAVAATHGPMVNINGWEIGAFRLADGRNVYCTEPGTHEPNGPQRSPQVVTELPGYTGNQPHGATGWNGTVVSGPASGDTLRYINYVLSVHGDTTNPDLAASVQLAVWMLRADPGAAAWLDHHLDWARANGGALYVVRAVELVQEAHANAKPPSEPDARLTIEAGDDFGTGLVHYPAGTRSLTITGGSFLEGGTTATISDQGAGALEWRAHLHEEGWQRQHAVSIGGTMDYRARGWPASLVSHPPVNQIEQGLGSGVGPVDETRTRELPVESLGIDAQFAPVLSTRVVDSVVENGAGEFVDTVTLSTAEGSAPWPQRVDADGETEFMPLVADGVLYGPFADRPTPADEVPQDAPVAGRSTLVATEGPGTYEAAADSPPRGGGYYSWVWTVSEAEQDPAVRSAELLPADYLFRDRFGLAEEGHLVPTPLRWSTVLIEQELPAEKPVLRDTVTPTIEEGEWVRDADGERIPATLRLTVYHSETEPERSAEVPEGVEEVASGTVEVRDPDIGVSADPIRLPEGLTGWVTVRTCLLGDDQSAHVDPGETPGEPPGAVAYREEAEAPEERIFFEEWCDDYGIPEETAEIIRAPRPDLTETGAEAGAHRSPAFAAAGLILAGGCLLPLAGTLRRLRDGGEK